MLKSFFERSPIKVEWEMSEPSHVLMVSEDPEKVEYAAKRCLLSCRPLTRNIAKAYMWSSLPLLPRNKRGALLAHAASNPPRPGTVQRAWASAKPHAGRPMIVSTPSMLPRQTCAEVPASGDFPALVRNGDRSLLVRALSGKQAGIYANCMLEP